MGPCYVYCCHHRMTDRNEAPRSKRRGITELNSEAVSEGEVNPVASYGECQVQAA